VTSHAARRPGAGARAAAAPAAEPAPPDAIAEACLSAAREAGCASADVFIKDSVSREATFPEASLKHAAERGIALRAFLPDGRSGIAAGTLPDAPASAASGEEPSAAAADLAARLVRRAVEAAACSTPSDLPDLPGPCGADGRGLGLFDPDIEGPPEELLEAAAQIEDLAARASRGAAADVRLLAVASATRLANSAGFSGSFRQTLARLDLALAGRREGARAATRVVRAARSLRGLAAGEAAAEAVALLEERTAPRLAPSGIHQVLLAPRAAAELAAALSSWLARAAGAIPGSAGSALRRGEKVATRAVTVTDDGRLPGGVASAPFDGEGTRTRRTLLVDRGIVQEFLRDLAAGRGGAGSTGNAVRASYREAPALRPTNLFIHPGAAPPADLLASVRRGIWVSALGRIPPLPGPDAPFAVPFTGRWIHGGKVEAPIGGGLLAGTLREVLLEIEAAGSDLTFSHRRGSFGAPSLLVRRAPVRSS
jgi:PmbA protein